MDFRFSMSQGIVSGLGRSVGLFRSRNSIGYENFIQVDAAINPGNSGGPLSNHRGEVIGMNTAIATHDTSSEGRFSGIGLAIPLDMIESVATQVIDGGVVRKGFLGVSVVDQHSPVYRWLGPLGLPSTGGAVVSSVSEGLAQAGLVRGDVIARYDDLVVQDPDAFWRLVADDEDGRSRLAVWRANPDEATSEWIDVLIEAPEIDGGRTASHKDLHLINLIDDMSSYYRDIGFERTGVLVVSTQPGQPARQGGVRSGDIICGINGREMNTVDQLRSTVSSILPNALVELAIWRPTGNSSRMLTLEIRLTELERRVR
jgi:serine protease Do